MINVAVVVTVGGYAAMQNRYQWLGPMHVAELLLLVLPLLQYSVCFVSIIIMSVGNYWCTGLVLRVQC